MTKWNIPENDARIEAAVRAGLEAAWQRAESIGKGYSDGGDEAIGCGVLLTAASIRAIAADPAAVAAIAKGASHE